MYGRIGTHTVEFGTIAAWAVDVLNALTGNLDRPGGAMLPSPAHERAGTQRPRAGFPDGSPPQSRQGPPRGSLRVPGRHTRRRDRDTGRRPDPSDDHDRRQSRRVDARQRPARRGIRPTRLRRERRHLPQRVHASRQRDPAAAVVAGAQRVPHGLLRAGGAQLRRMVAPALRARRPGRARDLRPARAPRKWSGRGRRSRRDRRPLVERSVEPGAEGRGFAHRRSHRRGPARPSCTGRAPSINWSMP